MNKQHVRDAAWAIAIAVVVAIVWGAFDMAERWHAWAQNYEKWELDELLGLAFALLIGSLWFAFRRLREAGEELRQREEAEAKARDSEARFRAIIDNAPVEIYVKDLEGRYLIANRCSHERRSGDNEFIGKTAYDLFPKDQADLYTAHDEAVITSGEAVERELDVDGRSGPRTFYGVKFPIRDGDGAIKQIGAVITDITELNRREAALRDSDERLKAIIDNTPCGITLKDADGHYLLVNRWFEEIFEITSDEARGKTSREIFSEAFADSGIAHDQAVLTAGQIIAREEELRLADGTHTLLTAKFPVRGGSGEVVAIGAISTDITERKRAEQVLQRAKEEAEEANAAKSRFLAAASHDLRQPLQGLSLLVEVLDQETDERERQTIVVALRRAVSSMGGMLNALLDISQLDAGAVRPEIKDFPLGPFLAEVVRHAVPRSQAKGLELRVVASSATVRSDRMLLGRIVENLLSNAIRYTAEGKILIGCRRRGGQLRIEVWDSGVGIGEEHLRRIFEEYYQLTNPARDRSKGLGLGLAIVDRLVRVLNHRIDVKSIPGRGSMFAVEVPRGAAVRAADARVNGRSQPNDFAGQTILVVEDDDLVMEWTQRLLNSWGLEVIAAHSGAAARRRLEQASTPPDLLMADYRLPGEESGLELVCQIRSRLESNIPSVITTGDTSHDLARQCDAAGCALMHKPIAPAKLRSLLRWLLDNRPSA